MLIVISNYLIYFCQTAAMTFEDEKMENAMRSLKRTQKMCDVDSLFEGVISKRPSEKWTTEERIQRMIIWADCELFMAFLMFLKQSKYDATTIISSVSLLPRDYVASAEIHAHYS